MIRDFRNIENRDAVLAYDRVEFVTDERGVPVTRWDGETMKVSPVTGEHVPDESARKPVERYVNPRKAAWPDADFIVGNPPFIGSKRMRDVLGDGYVDALQRAWPDVPQATDLVMRWWHHAASLARNGAIERFGFITTNSLRQTYVRRAVEPHLQADPPLSIVFAIPDHPWVDSADGAAVRIAMTVGLRGRRVGRLLKVERELAGSDDLVSKIAETGGRINADLSVGVDVTACSSLLANSAVCSVGMKTIGAAFQVDASTAKRLGLGHLEGADAYIRPYVNGREFAGMPRGLYVLDFYGLEERRLFEQFPDAYQYLHDYVKPEREHNRNKVFRERWWVIGHPRQQFRSAVEGITRYVATIETAKHRFFAFLPVGVAPDSTLVTFALEDAAHLGVLSSMVHSVWVESNAGSMGVYIGNIRYNKTICFEPFPFPDLHAADKFSGPIAVAQVDKDGRSGETQAYGEYPSERIRNLAEQLDAHRKRQQAAHPDLTLTGMYNVLEKLRSGEPLTAKERAVHEQGLVSVLRQLHDELDEAVLYAYGWADLLPLLRIAHGNDAPVVRVRPQAAPGDADAAGDNPGCASLTRATDDQVTGGTMTRDDARRAFDEAILERLVALNAERAAEEARGHVRWLRPEFQDPDYNRERTPEQARLDTTDREPDDDTAVPTGDAAMSAGKPQPWPKDAVEQVRAVADLLATSPVPLTLEEIGARFTARGPWKKRLPQLLDMLVALGRAEEQGGRYGSVS